MELGLTLSIFHPAIERAGSWVATEYGTSTIEDTIVIFEQQFHCDLIQNATHNLFLFQSQEYYQWFMMRWS
jgi:hypothetical protein